MAIHYILELNMKNALRASTFLVGGRRCLQLNRSLTRKVGSMGRDILKLVVMRYTPRGRLAMSILKSSTRTAIVKIDCVPFRLAFCKPARRWPSAAKCFVLLLLILCSCARQHDEIVIDQCHVLYSSYMDGGIDQARQSMLGIITLLENRTLSRPGDTAHGLWLAYARLHVIKRYAKNSNLAAAYLLEVRSWYLKKLELTGTQTDEAMKLVDRFDSSKCVEMVDNLDGKTTGGKGPKYSSRTDNQ